MPYECDWENCDARYRDYSSLRLHKLKHTGEMPYKCAICDKVLNLMWFAGGVTGLSYCKYMKYYLNVPIFHV